MGLIMPTLQEKYDFLLRHLQVVDVDLWECDALIEMKDKLYFQLDLKGDVKDMDSCVENALICERERLEFEGKIAELKVKGPLKVKKGTILLRSKK
jgi:hypothetical protein